MQYGCSKKSEETTKRSYYLSYSELSVYAFESLDICNGLKINYRVQGNLNGRDIIFIHGGGDSQGTWDSWVDSLKDKYRIITFDLPGHGLTDPLPGNDYSISKFVEYTEIVVDRLNISDFVIVGHSFGGETAVNYVLKNPGKAIKMVLLAPGGFIQENEREASKQMVGLTDEQVKQYFFPEFTGTKMEFKKGFKDYYFNMSNMTEETLTRLYNLGRYKKNRGAVAQFNINHLRNDKDFDNLHLINIPTQVLWGKEDKIVVVETAYKFKKGIKNTEVILYDNVGHMIHEEKPEKIISDAVSFINGKNQ
jgi:pimeloyl-ACP methyl ester carboxylesterase